jgi:hypothetical protein
MTLGAERTRKEVGEHDALTLHVPPTDPALSNIWDDKYISCSTTLMTRLTVKLSKPQSFFKRMAIAIPAILEERYHVS